MSTELSTTRTPETIVGEIVTITRQTQKVVLDNAIEVGRRFTELKAVVPHGEWGRWLEAAHYSKSSANNMMRIFEAYGADELSLFGGNAKSQTFGNLEYSKALALLAVPEEEREEFAREVDAEHMSVRELKAEIQKQKAAALEAQNQAEGWRIKAALAEESAGKREQELTLSNKLVEGLKQEKQLLSERVAELQSRPAEVAVETVDATAEQIAQAEAQGRATAEKELMELKDTLQNTRSSWKETTDELERVKGELASQEKNPQKEAIARMMGEINAHFKSVQVDVDEINKLLQLIDDVSKERARAALVKALRGLADQLEANA